MPPQAPPTAISLKIKVPPGHLSAGSDSFDLGSIPVSTPIGSLRQQIHDIIPSRPAPERQRLLYGGRALVDNEQTIADALNTKRDPSQTEYVVHLLVKGEQGTSTPSAAGGSLGGGVGHRRVGSAPPPSSGRAATPQRPEAQQPQAQVQAQVPPQHMHMHQHQHQQMMARQLHMQQQMMLQQMAQAQQRGGMMPPSFMPAMPGQQVMPVPMQMQPDMHPPPRMRAPGLDGQQDPPTPAAPQTNGAPTTNGQPQTQSAGTEQPGNPSTGANAQPQQPPIRPVSGQGFHLEGIGPNGQRFQIHQQTLNIPYMGMGMGVPGQQFLPPGFPPQMPGMMPAQIPQAGIPMAPPRQQNGPSALDRARENVTEMRRMLDEMRNQPSASEEQRARIGEMQQRAQDLNDYIDPLHLGGNTNPGTTSTNTGPGTGTAANPRPPPPQIPGPGNQHPPVFRFPRAQPQHLMPAQQQHHQLSTPNPNEVTAYLLSSPQGPQALLFSPQHGAYTGSFAPAPLPTRTTTTTTNAALQPWQNYEGQPFPYTTPVPPPGQAAPVQAPAGVLPEDPVALAARQQLAQAQAQDPLAPIQPLLAHVWLLLRILIFAYFLLGSNLGYSRFFALLGIGLVFWGVRAGVLGDLGRGGEGGVLGGVRRWWDGVVGVPPQQQQRAGAGAQQPEGQRQDGAGEVPAGQQGQNAGDQQRPQEGGGNARMPTPEQVAQRLLNEERERRGWLRERIRPVERAVALFVASLWPGIGEVWVRAREEEVRRVREEEEAEAVRRRAEEAGGGRKEGAGGGKERERKEAGRKGGEGGSKSSEVEAGGSGGGEKAAGTTKTAEGVEAGQAS